MSPLAKQRRRLGEKLGSFKRNRSRDSDELKGSDFRSSLFTIESMGVEESSMDNSSRSGNLPPVLAILEEEGAAEEKKMDEEHALGMTEAKQQANAPANTIEVSKNADLAVSALTTSQLQSERSLAMEDLTIAEGDEESDNGESIELNVSVPKDYQPDVSALEMDWHMSGSNLQHSADNDYTPAREPRRESILRDGTGARSGEDRRVSFGGYRITDDASGSTATMAKSTDEAPSSAAPGPMGRSHMNNEEADLYRSFDTAVTSFNAPYNVQTRNASKLVAPKSSLDPSWFASRGMMSQKSFRKYKKEMKQNVLRQIREDSDRSPATEVERGRRAARGANAESARSSHTRASYCTAQTYDSALFADLKDRRHSDGDLIRSRQNSGIHPMRRASNRWVESCLSSLQEYEEEEKHAAFASLIEGMLSERIQSSAGLSQSEVLVLNKMIVRLSSGVGDGADDGSGDDSFLNDSDSSDESTDTEAEMLDVVLDGSSSTSDDDRSSDSESHQDDASLEDEPQPLESSIPESMEEVACSVEKKEGRFEGDAKSLHDETTTEANVSPVPQDQISSSGGNAMVVDPKVSSLDQDDSHVVSPREVRGLANAADMSKPRPPKKLLAACDVLTEGMDHLFTAVLVNMYGKLRELSVLGHASVRLADIDVNSHQSLARKKEMKRLGLLSRDDKDWYLANAKSARSIIQAVLEANFMDDVCGYRHQLGMCHSTNTYDAASLLPCFKTMVTKGLFNKDFEVVWFSDWLPKDIIYCICVDRDTSTVTVIFHGKEKAVAVGAEMMEHTNPVAHELGDCDAISLRAEVSEELLRPRKDTGKTIIDEIKNRVEKIGEELTGGGGYHLTVTGHALGAGLATVAGFYLAADPSLASVIRMYTFASSRVGCRDFQRSFRYLEDTGRLQHARFANSNEFRGPLWDPNGSWGSNDWYRHVGMNIGLHANSAQPLYIEYDRETGMLAEVYGWIRSCICRSNRKAGIAEYQKRLHSSRESLVVQRRGERGTRARCTLSLDELYAMKESFGKDDSEAKGSSSHIYVLIAIFVSLEVALLLRFASHAISGGI